MLKISAHLRKALLFGLLCVFSIGLSAQLTIKVTAIPANTPPGDDIYVAGTFNNWAAGSSTHILTPLGNGQFSITVNPAPGTVEFKFTRGAWATVEGNAGGGFQPNHTVQYSGTAKEISLAILSWEDLGGNGTDPNGTAAPNVSILDNAFYIPQLNRNRRIWLYLPPDYAASTKNYPVLYLQDGQNLFDNSTSFSGEWKVDESLNALFANGDYGCIVVGIDNGGVSRLDEYSPWVNAQYGGGEGDLYVQFIINTLKPYIDSHYRTLSDRLHTGIGGSSMGGLISQYALIERQDVFSKAAVFSPAFWFAGSAPANHVLSTGKESDLKVYFLAGGEEPDYVAQDMTEVADAMLGAGFSPFEIYFETPSDGQHSEWFWAREFPAAYVWLFQNSVSAAELPSARNISLFPNPAGSWLRLSGVDFSEKVEYQVIGTDGKIWQDSMLQVNAAIPTNGLPAGMYFLKMKTGGKVAFSGRFLVAE